MQVCKNGHQITEVYHRSPEFRQKYCEKCGAETIITCPECGAEIKGHYHVEGVVSMGSSKDVPKYCHDCGEPYPWTE
ncbi:DUF2321 domain-containing protein [Halomarina pelagica]|uniref:DUF2321 domain-containing protein n=1 Tax=Halomarina pelagica TaxID=2961599 RepID=UPI0034A4744E